MPVRIGSGKTGRAVLLPERLKKGARRVPRRGSPQPEPGRTGSQGAGGSESKSSGLAEDRGSTERRDTPTPRIRSCTRCSHADCRPSLHLPHRPGGLCLQVHPERPASLTCMTPPPPPLPPFSISLFLPEDAEHMPTLGTCQAVLSSRSIFRYLTAPSP